MIELTKWPSVKILCELPEGAIIDSLEIGDNEMLIAHSTDDFIYEVCPKTGEYHVIWPTAN